MDPVECRSAVRAFVRTHHPDVGGDPETFAAGLRRLRDAGGELRQVPGTSARWPAEDDPRLDVPITVVTARTRAFGVISRLARRIRLRLTRAIRRRIRGRNISR